MKDLLVIDVECKKDFHEVGGRSNFDKLGISVAGVYDYADDTYRAYEEDELGELERLVGERDGVIGFNIQYFDYTVMQPYFKNLDLSTVYTVDIMKHLEDALGFRVPLSAVAKATLGEGKSGHGRDATVLFRQGKMDELKKYCLDDVRLTKEIYEKGKEKGLVTFLSKTGRERTVPANWATAVERDSKVRDLLREALTNQRMVHITYNAPGEEEPTARDIEVQAIRGAAVEAFCHLRQDRRRFKLERILDATVKEKSNTQQTLF